MSLLRSPACCGHPILDRPIVPQDLFLTRIGQGERLYTFRLQGGPPTERLAAVDREAPALNQPPMTLSFFPGGGGPVQPGAVLSNPVIQLRALKQADDGAGWIVRLFSPASATRQSLLEFPSLAVKQSVELGPFELKTLRISPDDRQASETDLLERPL